jgi:hypothetical protein
VLAGRRAAAARGIDRAARAARVRTVFLRGFMAVLLVV